MGHWELFTLDTLGVGKVYKRISGIYALYFFNPKTQEEKYYVGSSKNIRKRLQYHLSVSKNGEHPNTSMQKDFSNPDINFQFFLLEECEEEELLDKEIAIIETLDFSLLHNKTLIPKFEEMKPYLDKAVNFKAMQYTVNKEGCWISKGCVDSRGNYSYARVRLKGKKETKHITAHRLSYYKHYGEYPNIVRHLCDNKRCINPDHLVPGSVSDNSKDLYLGEYLDIIKKYEEFNCDVNRLVDHRWKTGRYKSPKSARTRTLSYMRGLGLEFFPSSKLLPTQS